MIYKEGAVYAKEAGIITEITEVSDTVTNTTIAIAPLKKMSLSVSIDETNILALSVGQEANISIDSLGDETYTGSVSEINKTGGCVKHTPPFFIRYI